MQLVVKRAARPLRGQVAVPGDKSIGHRSLIFASLARGTSEIHGLSDGLDNVATRRAFSQMGVVISEQPDGDDSFVRVQGVGLDGLSAPRSPLDCGNSGTTMRLLAGLLSGQRFGSELFGDESLTRRPMARVTAPLRQRGAQIVGEPFTDRSGKQNERPPLRITAASGSLSGIEYNSPVASAQVKSAVLLSGLYADGPTVVREPKLSRDHTERMMRALGYALDEADGALKLSPVPARRGHAAFRWHVPGDFSSAAFLVAAASLVPDSDITISNVGLNPTRIGFLDAVRAMGANIDITEDRGAPHGYRSAGDEPVVRLRVRAAQLRASSFSGDLVTRMIDEVPVLSVCCASSEGTSSVRDASELRVKESDRIATMSGVLGAFGIATQEREDGLDIVGGSAAGTTVAAEHDHRVAMSAAILGLVSDGETRVLDADCVATSYPAFVAHMQSLGADIYMKADASSGEPQ